MVLEPPGIPDTLRTAGLEDTKTYIASCVLMRVHPIRMIPESDLAIVKIFLGCCLKIWRVNDNLL